MQGEILNRVVQTFVDGSDQFASGDERIIVLIESPSESDKTGRKIMTRNLKQDLNHHFYHAVELCNDDGMYNLTNAEFFKSINYPNPVDVLLENMDVRVEDCNQIQIFANSQTTGETMTFMDMEAGRQPFSDLLAYYLFVIQWPKDDTTSATVLGRNLGDYIKEKLTVQ